jgi:hypothetical protein
VTCICIERDSGDAITRIVRTDDSHLPSVIFHRGLPPPASSLEAARSADEASQQISDCNERLSLAVMSGAKNSRQMAGRVERQSVACQTDDSADLYRLAVNPSCPEETNPAQGIIVYNNSSACIF